jgi:hypothetical protein
MQPQMKTQLKINEMRNERKDTKASAKSKELHPHAQSQQNEHSCF